MRALLTLALFFSAFSALADEEIIRNVNLQPGAQEGVNIPAGRDDLVGWRMIFADLAESERVSECPEEGCVVMTSLAKESTFRVGARFGALAQAVDGSASYEVKNMAPFPVMLQIVVLKSKG